MNDPAHKSYFLKKAQIRAFSLGGECHANSCAGANDRLEWSCRHGHRWEEQLGKVLRGSWCPVCEHQNSAAASAGSDIKSETQL